MGKYLLRRILQMIPVVLGATLLVYALVFALPGAPVKAMFEEISERDRRMMYAIDPEPSTMAGNSRS